MSNAPTQTSNPWRALRTGEPFDCPYFSVRSDLVSHAGGPARAYNSIRMKFHGVAILPIDDEGCTMLVGQHRYVLDRYSWELPGGGAAVDRPALEAARTELSEETGFEASHWLQVLDTFVAPGTLDETTRGFVAWGLRSGAPHPEADEQIALRKVAFSEAIDLALRGEIGHVSSVALLMVVQAKLMRHELADDLSALLRR